MTDKTPTEYADDAAEAIRALNHATGSRREGWQYPGDAYEVVGDLEMMARRLPQALTQARELLEQLRTGGHIRHDKGGDGLPDVMAAMAGLRSAAEAAEALRDDLRDVHAALSPLAWKE